MKEVEESLEEGDLERTNIIRGLGKNQSWKSPSHDYPILAQSKLSEEHVESQCVLALAFVPYYAGHCCLIPDIPLLLGAAGLQRSPRSSLQ